MFNPNKLKKTNTEKPKASKNKLAGNLKRLGWLGLITTSTLGTMDISKMAYAKGDEPNMELDIKTEMRDVTKITKEIAAKEPKRFSHDIVVTYEGQEAEILRFLPKTSATVIVTAGDRSPDLTIDGVRVHSQIRYPIGEWKQDQISTSFRGSQGSRAEMFMAPVDPNKSAEISWKTFTKEVKAFDVTDPNLNTKVDYDSPNLKILENGKLNFPYHGALYVPKGKKIPTSVKLVEEGQLRLWDADSLSPQVKFINTTIEFYGASKLIRDSKAFNQLKSQCDGCTIVLFKNGINAGMEGEDLAKFQNGLLAETTKQYTAWIELHRLEKVAQMASNAESNFEGDGLLSVDGHDPFYNLLKTTPLRATKTIKGKSDINQTQDQAQISSHFDDFDSKWRTQDPYSLPNTAASKPGDYNPNQATKVVEQAQKPYEVTINHVDTSRNNGPIDLSYNSIIGRVIKVDNYAKLRLNISKDMMSKLNTDAVGYFVSINGGPATEAFKTSETQNIEFYLKFLNLKAGDRVVLTQAIYNNGTQIPEQNPTTNSFTMSNGF
jgi:hypothetical protein